MSKTAIHICLGLDYNYCGPFYVALTSIFFNNPGNDVIIHAIIDGVSTEQKNQIQAYVQHFNNEIYFYDLNSDSLSEFKIPENTHFTKAIFYRLFFPHLVSEKISKLIYLDTDMIVNCNLIELYNSKFETPLAATIDNQMPPRYELGLTSKSDYFNSGMLLINLDQWKSQKITEKTIDILLSQPLIMSFPDQDALNITLRNNWHSLDNKFNVMRIDVSTHSGLGTKEILEKELIIHFNDRDKPWNITCGHPFKEVYEHYFLKLCKPNIDINLLEKNFELGFMSTMIMLQKEDLFNAGTILLCGFVLHVSFLHAVLERAPISEHKVILNSYFKLEEMDDDALTIPDMKILYDSNKVILQEYYQSIKDAGSVAPESEPDWLEVWTSLCRDEVKINYSMLEVAEVNERIVQISKMINKALDISYNERKLLGYFADQIFLNE